MGLRVGVIGTGYLGSRHAEKLSRLEQASLVGVFDRASHVGAEVASRVGCRNFSSIDELLRQVDAAVVAVPAEEHCRVASHVIASGRAAFVEKPIAATLREAEYIVSLARTQGVPLQIGHVERFNPVFETAADHISVPRFIEAHRLNPFVQRGLRTDVVLELMIHDLDLIMTLVNQPAARVEAVGVPIESSSRLDTANARIEFVGGCVANLTASRVAATRMRVLHVFQPGECIWMDLAEGRIIRTIEPSPENRAPMREVPVRTQPRDALSRELESFVDAVLFHRVPRVTGEQGLAALELALEVRAVLQQCTSGV